MEQVLKEKILNLRIQGKNYNEIKKELGCTKSVISYHCKNNKMAKGLNKPTQDEIDKANYLYSQGNNLKTICKELNRTKNCIKKYIVNYNSKRFVKGITRSQSVVEWRKRKKKELVDYKGGKCMICNYDKCIEALHFHHTDPLEKHFNISASSLAFNKLIKEVDKCVLLCSNCHVEVHQGLFKNMGL
jgi:transcriptional regulator